MNTSRARLSAATAATAAPRDGIPQSVKGYTARRNRPRHPAESRHLEWDLDTPGALGVDLDKLARNIAKLQRTCNANKIAVRPHAKTHKCAAIAKMQMAAGRRSASAPAKLSEAESSLPRASSAS
jgi:hypothetical protein